MGRLVLANLLLGTGSGTRARLLVRDLFTDSSGTALIAHTPNWDPSGAGWVQGIGTWDIEANRTEFASGSPGVNNVLINSESTRSRLECDIFTGTKDYSGFIVRAGSSQSNIEILLRRAEADVQIGSNDGGSRASISTGGSVLANTAYAVRIDITTATIEVSLDGSTQVSASTNFNQTQPNIGLFAWDDGTSGGYWDNLVITPL